MSKEFYAKVIKIVKKKPVHVMEIGVFRADTTMLAEFIKDESCRVDLVEPLPLALNNLRKHFGHLQNVTIYPFAIYKEQGTVRLAIPPGDNYKPASSYIEGVESPFRLNQPKLKGKETFIEVETRKIESIDDGTIEILSIDTEGCEWYAIEHLISRPLIISFEAGRVPGKPYINPYIKHIEKWMEDNNYKVWEDTLNNSDIIYIQKR